MMLHTVILMNALNIWNMQKDDKEIVYNHLLNVNDIEYNLTKTAEEMQELALILIQKNNKPNQISDEKIIEEIGDVIIRLKVLKKQYPKELITERINYKLNKFFTYIKEKKYKNI